MRDNLMGDEQGSVTIWRHLLPSANLKLAAPGIQPWVGSLLKSGNGEKPSATNVSGKQS